MAPTRSAVAAVALLWWAVSAAAAVAEDLNRIVLRVNEEILTLYEYEARKASEISSILASPRLDAAEQRERIELVGQAVMQSSFSEMLLLSFAQQQGIRISEAEVEEGVRRLLEQQGIETEEQLQQALASSRMTLEEVRDNTRRELLWQQVVGREVQPKVKIGEEELRAYYRNHEDEFRTPEQRWLKEVIVLDSSGLDDAELRRVAEEIRAALVAGGDPEAIVEPYREREVSTGLIDLDWLRAEELDEALSTAAWALEPGEYSAPIAARGGYHVVHLAGVRESELLPLAEVEERIRRREYGVRFNRELQSFLTRLEQSAYVVEDLPPESVGYRNLAPDIESEDELELFRAPVAQPGAEDDSAAETSAGS